MAKRRTWVGWCFSGLVAAVALAAAPALAQNDQLGAQSRAEAASRMIVLGVQQGISSLPPTSGQSRTYEFDPELSTFVPSASMGPTSFRSTETIGKGKWSLRGSATYFKLDNEFGPIKYRVNTTFQGTPLVGVTEFGLKARANVFLLNLGTNYGITDRIEVNFNIPISIVEARASQISTTPFGLRNLPPLQSVAGGVFTDNLNTPIADIAGQFDNALDGRKGSCTDPVACLALRNDAFDDLGFKFNDDASPGVGRISVGVKYLFLTLPYFDAAASLEFFNPSPNEGEFAGSASPAILPRLIVKSPVHKYVHIHADAGYDYDFQEAELRRFVWDSGFSLPFGPVTLDFGFGGSVFDVPIKWTPTTAQGAPDANFSASTITVVSPHDLGPNPRPQTPNGSNTPNELGDDYFDFLGGIKVRLADRLVLSGAVTTPLNGAGFRAPAVGTIAIEGYY